MPRPRRMRKLRRRRPVVRRRAKRSTGAKLINKVYSYVFKPNPQFLVSTKNLGEIVLEPNVLPMSGAISSPIAAVTGLANYYDMGFGLTFRLSDLTNSVNFRAIYDEYKILSVTAKATYLTTEANIQGLGLLPTMYYVMDNDNAVPPLSIHDVRGKQGSKELSVTSARNSFNLRIVPKQMISIGTVAGVSQIRTANAGWCDCSDSTAQHFAGKVWISNMYLPAGSNTNTAIQWEFTYRVAFRGAQNLY